MGNIIYSPDIILQQIQQIGGSPRAVHSTVASIAPMTSITEILPANDLRIGFYIFNDTSGIVYIKFGKMNDFDDYSVKIMPQAYYESGNVSYIGAIDAVWAILVNGTLKVTEMT